MRTVGDDGGGKWADFYAFVEDFIVGLVGLEGDGAFVELAVGSIESAGFGVLGDGFAVDFDFDGSVDDFDVVSEPLIVFYR